MIWPPIALSHWLRSLVWKGVKSWVRQSFSSVPTISTAELANWLEQADTSPLLLDARSAEEYEVSYLRGAHRAKTVAEAEAVIKEANIAKQTPIVVYCSIGYRSGRLGKALQAAGYEVTNLEGSIFQWANEGRSLVTANGPTQQVHPYSWLWGLLLASQ
ncbi:MAG: rhodanese-like domain-containing protein [Phormidesmis sp.]